MTVPSASVLPSRSFGPVALTVTSGSPRPVRSVTITVIEGRTVGAAA